MRQSENSQLSLRASTEEGAYSIGGDSGSKVSDILSSHASAQCNRTNPVNTRPPLRRNSPKAITSGISVPFLCSPGRGTPSQEMWRWPPSGPLLLPNPKLSGESTGKLRPGTVETVPRRLRARQARTAPAVPCAVSVDPYWFKVGLVALFLVAYSETEPKRFLFDPKSISSANRVRSGSLGVPKICTGPFLKRSKLGHGAIWHVRGQDKSSKIVR